MNLLQNARWTFLGYAVPIYFFFTAGPLLAAAAIALAIKREWSRWERLWWLLPLVCLPGVLHSNDPLWSTRQWLSWVIRGVIPGGVIFLTTPRQKQNPALLYWIYPIIIAASLLGLQEIFTNRNPIWNRFDYDVGGSRQVYADHNPLWDRTDNAFRGGIAETPQPSSPFYRPQYDLVSNLPPRGTQSNRIPYASTLVGFLPLGIWLLKYNRRYYTAYLIAVGLLASILLLAQVRSAWVGILSAILLMQALGLLRTRRETIKVAGGALLGLSVLLTVPKTRDILWPRIHSFHFAQSSIRERLDVLQTAAIMKKQWLLGVGFGQFPTVCKTYYPPTLVWRGTPDNQYLRWAIENGLPSFLLLAAFLIGLTWAGWDRVRRITDAREADYYKSLLVGWISVSVTFLFFDGFYWGACNMTYWSLLGLFATCLKSPQSAAP